MLVSTRTRSAAALVASLVCTAIWSSTPLAQPSAQSGDVVIVPVRRNFYMLAGAGANIGVSVGPEGFVVVDTGSAAMTDKVLAALDRLAERHAAVVQGAEVRPRVRYIINTSAHPDHIGGNEKLSRGGLSVFAAAAPGGLGNVVSNGGAAAIMAHETVTQRMSGEAGGRSAFPVGAWPTESYTGRQRSYYLNHEAIQVLHQPAAYSDGDSVVTFRQSDVIVTGELFDITRFPMIDIEKGGSIQGTLDALSRLIDLAVPPVPFPWQEDRTYLIPARGRVCDQSDLVEYRDAMTIVKDTIQDMIRRGMTLAQIKSANPVRAYRSRYGSDSGPWTTNMFIDAVYASLTAKKT